MERTSKTPTATTKTVVGTTPSSAPASPRSVQVTAPKGARTRTRPTPAANTGIVDASVPVQDNETTAATAVHSEPPPSLNTAPTSATKTARLIAMLQSDPGACIIEIAAAFGWLPHTTRAALTGLRKRGHAIARSNVDGVTRYRITDREVA